VSLGKKITFGVGAGALCVLVDGGCALVNIHILLKFITPAEAGYWLLIIACGGFLMQGQAALGPTITRRVAQNAWSDAAGKGVSPRIAGCATLVLIASATMTYVGYLASRTPDEESPKYLLSWFLYVIGLALNLNAALKFAQINGYGEIVWEKACRIVVSIFGVLGNLIALIADCGLLGLAFVFLLQGLLTMFAASKLLTFHTSSARSLGLETHSETRGLMLDAIKLLSLGVMGYLVVNAGTFIVEFRFGPEAVSQYVPLIRVGAILSTISILIPQAVFPFVARAWAIGDGITHRRLFMAGVWFSLSVYLTSALSLIAFADSVVPTWIGPDRYLGSQFLLLVLVAFAISTANVAHTSPIIASRGNAFIGPSIVNLILVVTLLWYLTGWLGLVGAPLAVIIGSILPSGWVIWQSYGLVYNLGKGASSGTSVG
jgi:O-antigen/teichoic acid export membrane protein